MAEKNSGSDSYPTISNTKATDGASVTLVGDGKIDKVEAVNADILLDNKQAKPIWKNWSFIGCVISAVSLMLFFIF